MLLSRQRSGLSHQLCEQRSNRSRLADRLAAVLAMWAMWIATSTLLAEEPADQLLGLIESHCLDCHSGASAEAGLDLDLADKRLSALPLDRWVAVHDRVAAGEMPPRDYAELPNEDREQLSAAAAALILDRQLKAYESEGRVPLRRLTTSQVEAALQDVLAIDIPLQQVMVPESNGGLFTTEVVHQAFSHFHMSGFLAAIDLALDEAIARACGTEELDRRQLDVNALARKDIKRRNREPELREGQAVVWASRLEFYGRLPETTAKKDAWYRIKFKAAAVKKPDGHGVWCSVRSGRTISSAPLLEWIGDFEATDEPQEFEFVAFLPAGHMLLIRPDDLTLPQARFSGGQVGVGEGDPQDVPGLALLEMSMEQIHLHGDREAVRNALTQGASVDWQWNETETRSEPVIGESIEPRQELTTALQRFAVRAYRGPVRPEELQPHLEIAFAQLDAGNSWLDALRSGCRSVLCSARFLFFVEQPGLLDNYALASRLSFALTGRPPDSTLTELAACGELINGDTLRQQAQRLLGSNTEWFVGDLADAWLDLDQIDFTEPDRRLAPKFDLLVERGMLAETRSFLTDLIANDRCVGELIDGDTAWLNNRLARFYGIDGVDGDQMRPVRLAAAHHRGGLLTQGAILKVTANGTSTSPVVRGVWLCERLLGEHVPPPPQNIPAIEPDVRGATTIREQLAMHRADASCASCHRKIDPPGFALENFDAAGQYREFYNLSGGKKGKAGPKIDASYNMPDGRHFDDLEEFQSLLSEDLRPIAKNYVETIVRYTTGMPVQFADRQHVERIVDRNSEGFGMKQLLLDTIDSPIFRHK